MDELEFLLDLMTWSFSRLNSFYNCPYEWKLHYLDLNKPTTSFFAQYGSFMHSILEMYAKEEISLFELSEYYESHFWEEVTEDAPPNKYVDIKQSYYEKGLDYLDNIDLILEDYDVLGVEKEVRFTIGGYEMVGFIDLLLRRKSDGKIIILDHKSATIKFKKNGEVSKTDLEHVEEFKKQLYLYSIAVIEEYGHVDFLEWNLFKMRDHLQVEWNEKEFEDAKKWAVDTIKLIERETEWAPNNTNDFYCRYLCGQRENACEYKN